MHHAATRLAALAASIAAALACANLEPPEPPSFPPMPVLERLSDERLQVRWPPGFANGPVQVFSGSSPEGIDRSRLLGVSESGPVELLRSDGAPLGLDRPLYVELRDGSGPGAVVAERRLPLEGADNFRDLGGYATRDGRTVRWGVLFRSNELSGLTGSDLAYLSRMGLRLLCDFRSEPERRRHPDRVPKGTRLEVIEVPVVQEGVDPEVMRDKILSGGVAELGIERTMRRAYRAFVTEHSAAWANLLRRLARPESLPTLVHCTAGKDRTGFAAALVLLALGVPEATVFADYLLTNTHRADYSAFVLRWAPLVSFFRTRPEDLLPLLEARRAYLQASVDAMVELHGSVDGYLRDALGVDDELRAALAANLLDRRRD